MKKIHLRNKAGQFVTKKEFFEIFYETQIVIMNKPKSDVVKNGLMIDFNKSAFHMAMACCKKIDVCQDYNFRKLAWYTQYDYETLQIMTIDKIFLEKMNSVKENKKELFSLICDYVEKTRKERQEIIDEYNETSIDDFLDE